MEKQIFAPRLDSNAEKNDLIEAILSGRVSFPWMNGGMGIRFSDDGLVIPVIREGGIGVLSGAMTGYPDIADTIGNERNAKRRQEISHAANQTELLREIHAVRNEHPHAILGVNLMQRASDYEALLRMIGESGLVDFVFVGAGLPRELPEMMKDFPHMHYIPIVSTVRAAELIMRVANRPETGNRKPAAFYVELPHKAGGHLGAKDTADALDDVKFNAAKVQREIVEKFPEIPLILAGGVAYREDVEEAFKIGYNGIALGTRLLLTKESGLFDEIIRTVYLNPNCAIVTRDSSPARLPSRLIPNPDMDLTVANTIREARMRCVGCMSNHTEICGFLTDDTLKEAADYKPGESSYCIPDRLGAARRGKLDGLRFTGSRLDELRKDLLYRIDSMPEGALYVPSVREAVDFVLGSFRPTSALV